MCYFYFDTGCRMCPRSFFLDLTQGKCNNCVNLVAVKQKNVVVFSEYFAVFKIYFIELRLYF
ncbi:hypothetical protein GCM10009410_21380 [Shewanella ulleungensis]|jgi:hypothetical protein|uniref:Uncharacterized protein n=1 Tax=Shewanella ulleungensis TaxID=2282699 RepID=A0ABQ2QP64_9GAMM|nr:hypothetical protein GCM10009410_21380 [Shewanella ulleungensis]